MKNNVNKKSNNMKKLIPAAGMLAVSATMLATSTYAWFSMNRTVTAKNMQVKAVASSSLAIAQATPVGTLTEIEFSTAATSLIPATHFDSSTYGSATTGTDASSSGLIHVTNNADVDAAKGYASEGKTLAYTYCTNTDDDKYYVDYVSYIASSGTALTNQDLKAKLFVGKTQFDALQDTTKAVSVDFYVSNGSTALGTYKGTLNLSSLTTTDATPTASSLYKTAEITIGSDMSIPVNGASGSYIQVTMRVYIDGALQKSSGQAYVYSDAIDTNNVGFAAEFAAVEHA